MTDPITQSMMQGAAGASGDKIYVDDVFAIDRYKGNSQDNRDIVNGLDLAGEGGAVFIKCTNDNSQSWVVGDSVIGGGYNLDTSSGNARDSNANTFKALLSNGFRLGSASRVNSGFEYVSYSFRKCPQFFDIVSYTGTGSPQSIAHNLGCVPGALIVKSYSASNTDWRMGHRMLNDGSNPWNYSLRLDSTAGKASSSDYWNNTAPTDTHFTVGGGNDTNTNGASYVAYLFAHEEAAFGEDGLQKIITCGNYTGNGSAQNVNMGSEGQWTMLKNEDASCNWYITDNLFEYGMANESGAFGSSGSMNDAKARGWNINVAQSDNARVAQHANGIQIRSESQNPVNTNGHKYPFINVYSSVGKRAKPRLVGSDVFTTKTHDNNGTCPPGNYNTGWPVEFAFKRRINAGENWQSGTAKSGNRYYHMNVTDNNNSSNTFQWDSSTGFGESISNGETAWMWRQSAGFDCQWVTGEGAATYNHNLGQVPEMIWVGNIAAADWRGVGHHKMRTSNPWNAILYMNTTSTGGYGSQYWNNTAPTATQFTLGSNTAMSGGNNSIMVMLWCSVPGICKIDDYNGDGGTSNAIDCGFQPRYVMIKRVDSSGDWKIWDYARGNNMLRLNSSNAQVNDVLISFTSTGFTLISPDGTVNGNGGRYIYHAQA